MPRSDSSSLALGTRLASGLSRARQKYVFVPYRELAYIMDSPVTVEKKKLDSYFQVGTYRVAGSACSYSIYVGIFCDPSIEFIINRR